MELLNHTPKTREEREKRAFLAAQNLGRTPVLSCPPEISPRGPLLGRSRFLSLPLAPLVVFAMAKDSSKKEGGKDSLDEFWIFDTAVPGICFEVLILLCRGLPTRPTKAMNINSTISTVVRKYREIWLSPHTPKGFYFDEIFGVHDDFVLSGRLLCDLILSFWFWFFDLKKRWACLCSPIVANAAYKSDEYQ